MRLAILIELLLAAAAYGSEPPVAFSADPPAARSDARDVSAASVFVQHNSDAGTGTVIHADDQRSLVITAAHVVEDGRGALTVTTPTGERYTATYLAGSRVRHTGPGMIAVDGPDLALLEVAAKLPAVPVAERELTLRERVRMWGYGGGRFRALVGESLGFARWTPTNSLTSLPTVSGDSGAGVINDAGELVAVHSGTDGESRARHVPLGVVREFLRGRAKQRDEPPVAVVVGPPVAAPQSSGWQLAPEYPHPTHDLYRRFDGRQWFQEWRPKAARGAVASPACPPGQT